MNEIPSAMEPNHPSSSLTHEMVLELLPAYVLAVLEPDEMLAVQRYLEDHPELEARLAELEATVDLLALAPEEVEPPARAKEALMARVMADVKGAQASRQEGSPASKSGAAAVLPRAQANPLRQTSPGEKPIRQKATWLERWQGRLSGLFWPTLAATTVLALLVAVVYAALSWNWTRRLVQDLEQARQEIAQLQEQVNQLTLVNQRLEQELGESRRQIALFAGADRLVTLTGTAEAPEAKGAFYISDTSGLLVLHRLPPLSPQQTYEFWLIPAQGDPVPAGLIPMEEEGVQTVVIPLENFPPDLTAVGLSIEPAGGSPTPTGPIVLFGEIS